MPLPFPSVAARSRRGRPGTRASARPLLVLTRTAAKPTADQMHVLEILKKLYGAADWRGVAAQERAARAVAATVRTSMPIVAAFVCAPCGTRAPWKSSPDSDMRCPEPRRWARRLRHNRGQEQ